MDKEERISTGIAGLDEILVGGLPPDRLYLVEGNPGTGKTTLALQFLMEGVRKAEKALYVTLSETKAELLQVARSHGWTLEGIALYELEAIEDRIGTDDQYTFFHPAEVELGETTKRICAQVEAIQPSRVVFDSLSEMRLLARDPLRYRRQILGLKQFFVGRQCTVMLLDDLTGDSNDLQLQSISHGVIELRSTSSEHGTTPRHLRVVKMRGVPFQEGIHDFEIIPGGIAVYPRLIAAQERRRPITLTHEVVSSHIPSLDALLGGGLTGGTSTLLLGPAGSGKSSVATQYIASVAQNNQRVACYMFEENERTFLARSAGFGKPLDKFVASGKLAMQQVDPAKLSPGEFSFAVKKEVESNGARLVVIDSLNGYLNAMPSYKYLLIQMHELLTYLNDQNILSIMIMAQHGFMGASMQSPIDVSYMADTVILLRYFEAEGAVKKAISVMKKRTGAHEDRIREFRITANGLEIGQPLSQFHGVLTGVPTYTGGAAPLIPQETSGK